MPIRIRNFKTGSADPDPDPKKIGPDPQHCYKLPQFGPVYCYRSSLPVQCTATGPVYCYRSSVQLTNTSCAVHLHNILLISSTLDRIRWTGPRRPDSCMALDRIRCTRPRRTDSCIIALDRIRCTGPRLTDF